MVYIESKGITAKEEPNPRTRRERTVPHYLFIPDAAYGKDNVSLARTISDPKGYYDPVKREYKDQEINYLFLRGNATPVWKEQHVLWLLRDLAGTGIVEVAWVPGPDKVEYFHPERTNALDRRINGPYKLDEAIEVKTKTFKPVLDVVVRTADDVEKGRKLKLSEEERKFKADSLLTAHPSAKASKKK